MNIYFDNAATTPLAPEVLETMLPYMQSHFGNPSSIHAFGRQTRTAIEKARKIIAGYLNCSPAEIFFTSGGTESNNFALQNAVNFLGVKRIITSPIEHHCILHTVQHLTKTHGIKLEFVKLDGEGVVDLEDLAERCSNQNESTLVSLMHGNNELGNLLPFAEVSNICLNNNCLFHSDSVQTMSRYKYDLQKTKIAFLSGAAHKFHGPKGIGFIYVNAEYNCTPILFGGAQERNMRAGTENLYGIIGLSEALNIAYQNFDTINNKVTELKKYFITSVTNALPQAKLNGANIDNSLNTIANVNFEKYSKKELLLLNLDIEGICASGGSACSSGVDSGSHVIKALNKDVSGSIRFSFSKYNTKAEIDTVVEKLKGILI